MQSFLQYRKFSKAVEDEYRRNRRAFDPEKQPVESHPSDPVEPIVDNGGDLRREESESSLSGSDLSAIASRSITGSKKDEDFEIPEGYEPQRPQTRRLPTGVHEAYLTTQQSIRPDFRRTRSRLSGTSRSRSRGLAHSPTRDEVSRQGTALGHEMTGVDIRSRTTYEGKGQPEQSQKVFVVGYQGPDDPLNPHNWSYTTRITATIMIAFIGFTVGIASSIDSSALMKASAEFGVSEVVESLATGMSSDECYYTTCILC